MDEDRLDLIFGALSDPIRRSILARLARGEATVNELAEPFDVSLPAISKHLKVLERAGLISRGKEAQWRPCRLEPAPLEEARSWIDRYREIWEESFSRLDELLVDLQTGNASQTMDMRSSSPGSGSNRKESTS